jgi:XRE family aerobic/anaerobic benzoate catabolism transcriptional regulator
MATRPDNNIAESAELLKLVGEKVRNMRARRGMTRKMLAQHSAVSERYLAQLEQGCGNISIALLDRVAAALKTNAAELLHIHDYQTAEQILVSELLRELAADDQKTALQMLYERFSLPVGSQRRVALIGLRGAGKTTIGTILAEQLGLPFVRLVGVIETMARMSVSEIFSLSGQPGYRRLEEQALVETLKLHDRCVIEAGGSIVTEPRLLNMLLTTCFVIWLRARPEQYIERVTLQGDLRPMLDHADAISDLRLILSEREPFYAKAHQTIDTADLTIEESLNAVTQAVPEDIKRTD